METCIIYDWLSFTCKNDNPMYLVDLLGLSEKTWEEIKGANGYLSRMYYNSISIHYNGRNPGCWCELSGQGCRAYETFGRNNFDELFQIITDNTDLFNITRLDIAYDDHDQVIKMSDVINDVQSENYISKSTEWEIRLSSKGSTVNIGSPKSDTLIRIYDKAAERGYTDGTIWTRIELQLRDERARCFAELKNSIGFNFRGVLYNYLRFIRPSKTESNKSRWPTRKYWQTILDNAEKISIYKTPGVEYNLSQCENYVYKQAGNAISALIQIKGLNQFTEELNKTPRLDNPKYKKLIQDQNDLHNQINLDQPEPYQEANQYISEIQDKIVNMHKQ